MENGKVRLGGRVEIHSRGTRWVVARPTLRDAEERGERISGAFAASRVSEWCDDATAWPQMLALYESLAGDLHRPPTSSDINGAIKPRLRRAFENGDLVLSESTAGSSKDHAGKGGQAQRTNAEPPEPPPAPRRPVASPKTLHSFVIRFVDELGTPISGVALQFSHGASSDDATTDGNGVARLDDSAATSAKAKIVDVKALRKALKPRWDQARGDRKWLDESQGVTVVPLTSDQLPSFDLVADKLRIVSVQPYVAQVRLIGPYFETDKCFLLPSAIEGIRGVVEMYEEMKGSKLLVAGHTDSAGKPAYNDKLSLERAVATKDYLTDNVEGFYHWYGESNPAEKRWGAREDRLMIDALPDAAGRDPGESPVHWFQRTRGLKVDGIAGSETRHSLIREYMQLDGTSLPAGVEVTPHGCGEYFPINDKGDGVADAENRRIELFFFDGGLGIQPPPAGKNSKSGSAEYPEWVKRAKETRDHRTRHKVPFELTLQVTPEDPWTESDRICMIDAAGSVVFDSSIGAGAIVGRRRLFTFDRYAVGSKYRCEVHFDNRILVLFGDSDIADVQSASDAVAVATPKVLFPSDTAAV